jgi:hypothetical protein
MDNSYPLRVNGDTRRIIINTFNRHQKVSEKLVSLTKMKIKFRKDARKPELRGA